METLILFVLVFLLMILGVPVAVSLGLSSVLVIAFLSPDSMSSVALQLFTAAQNYTLLAIPFFVLASSFMTTGGVARRMIDFAIASVGHLRGGLAMASVLACMLFAALSGSSPATVVAIGSLSIVGMERVGYTKDFAAGVIANAGTLGILIPPSITMVVYAAATDVSVGRMFLAGVVPGLMAGFALMLAIYVVARVRNLPAGEWHGLGHLLRTGKEASLGLFLIFLILGGIYGGVFTPTEAAAVAAVYAFLVANFGYRDSGPLANMPWEPEDASVSARDGQRALLYGAAVGLIVVTVGGFIGQTGMAAVGAGIGLCMVFFYSLLLSETRSLASLLPGMCLLGRNLVCTARAFFPAFVAPDTTKALVGAARTTVMLMFIITNALLFAHVLTSEGIPQAITALMLDYGFTWVTFLIAVNILLLIGGQFMEPSGLLLIVAPVVFPIAMELGIDPIHLGIIMVVNMEIGMITPPIGLNLFVTSGITGMSLVRVVRAAAPFVMVLVAFLILVTYVPAISTTLPYAIMGPEPLR
ncbi:MAG: TRAP transporter large permease subunit [Alphaproteobacteria bacterium]|nr:TRAP transporter large permease subunit [Alphaproteobacteria bacterium]